MSEITAPPAPPAAPPPAAPAAAPAPGAPAPATKSDVNVPELFKMLMRDVSEEESTGDAEAGKKRKEAEAAAKPPENKNNAPAAPTAPAEPEMKLRKQKKERPALPLANEPASRQLAPEPAPRAAAPEAEAVRQFEEGLESNEREMLDDAKYLEKTWPDKYKGIGGKVEKFLRDHIARTEAADFDDQDPEYQRWVQENQPRLSRTEIRQIEESRIAENLRRENDGRFADLHFRSFAKEKEPEVDRVGQQAYAEMTNASLPDDVGSVLREQIGKLGAQKGYEEALKTHRMEIETAEAVLQAAADDIKEFHRLNVKDPTTGRTLSEFIDDPARDSTPGKAKYHQHQRLMTMVDGVGEAFKQTAGDEAIRNGKWFVTRKEWIALKPEARSRFWTFTNKEIVDRAKTGIKQVITDAIQQKHEYLKARGWTRQQASAAPAAPPPTNTPKAPPPPAPVPGGGAELQNGASATARSLASALDRG